MMIPQNSNRQLAVLIDAENVPAKALDGIFLELHRFGVATVKRAYGDFNSPQAEPWTKYFVRHAIIPQHQYSVGRHKNAADIALTIDAMDLLHSRGFDGFAIVSSDTDFLRLTTRLREAGLPVYVFGAAHSPERMRNAATQFFYFENLYAHSLANDPNSLTKPLQTPTSALPILKSVIKQLTGSPANWIAIATLEEQMPAYVNDFDPRSYGFLHLAALFEHLKEVVIDRSHPDGPRVRIKGKGRRRRSVSQPTASTTDEA